MWPDAMSTEGIKMKLSSKIYTAIVFAFLFAPIVVMLIYSFN